MEHNQLIAEFMGGLYDKDTNFPIHPDDMWLPFHGIVTVKNLRYERDWSWLMPVVEKIETTKIILPEKYITGFLKREGQTTAYIGVESLYDERPQFIGWSSSCRLVLGMEIWDSRDRYKSKIESIHAAVIGFIQWYNQQKAA